MNRPTAYGRIPRAVWALGFVSMFMDISSEMIHALLPLFLVGPLGASTAVVGIIEGVAEATASVTRVFSGTLSDWMRRRKVLAVIGYGLSAASKPLFAIAATPVAVGAARFTDRIGKGVRTAPRDALIADTTPAELRGAAFGLRQSLDTVGAVLGPLLALAAMVVLDGAFRTVFWIAGIPAIAAVLLLVLAVHEPDRTGPARPAPRLSDARRLGRVFWMVTAVAGLVTLARFSEAFLVLRATDAGMPLARAPLALVAMNVAFAAAYPAGALADRIGFKPLLLGGLVLLFGADLVLAAAAGPALVLAGSLLWGLHMAFSHGLLAALVAHAAPAELRGTAFGVYSLVLAVATLLSSVIAGALWDRAGPAATFLAGAGFTVLALLGVLAMRFGTESTPAG